MLKDADQIKKVIDEANSSKVCIGYDSLDAHVFTREDVDCRTEIT